MTKRLTGLLLVISMTAGLFAGCHNGGAAESTAPSPSTAPIETTAPVENPAPSEQVSPLEDMTLTLPAATGKVYYLNFQSEAEQAWLNLAHTYTELTGIQVDVVTTTADQYDAVLAAELNKAEAPTMFQCAGQDTVEQFGNYCLPLDDTDVIREMTTDVFNRRGKDGSTYAIGFGYEVFGMIVNTALLELSGHSLDEIQNFASLKAVADDIHANAAFLGFDAFASAGLDSSSSWRFSGQLANLPLYYQFRDNGVTEPPSTITHQYLAQYKNVWDMYVLDSPVSPAVPVGTDVTGAEPVVGIDLSTITANTSEAQFGEGKAVFYQNDSSAYYNLTKKYQLNPDDLAMIPIYCGVAGEEISGLCCGSANGWSVNANAPAENQKATLDFLKWVVTSEEGTTMMAEQFGSAPFRLAQEPENVFLAQANHSIVTGHEVIPWVIDWIPSVNDWQAAVTEALIQYTAGTGEWSAVETAFVDGWAQMYAREHESIS